MQSLGKHKSLDVSVTAREVCKSISQREIELNILNLNKRAQTLSVMLLAQEHC